MNSLSGRRGATLLEVLIAIMVTTMLSWIVILYGTGSRRQVNVYVETVKLAQVILKAKAQAVSIYYNPATPTCGYGVKLDRANNSYILFRYSTPTQGECAGIASLLEENIKPIESFNLVSGVTFLGGVDQVDEILFVPPDPKTYLWTSGVKVSPEGQLSLATEDSASVRVIQLSTGGQISY